MLYGLEKAQLYTLSIELLRRSDRLKMAEKWMFKSASYLFAVPKWRAMILGLNVMNPRSSILVNYTAPHAISCFIIPEWPISVANVNGVHA